MRTCLWFSGADPSWASWSSGADPFRFRKGSPGSLPYICLPVPLTHFCIFSPTVSFGAFSHSKGLGEKWHVCLWGSLQQMVFASQKRFFGVFPKLFCTFVSESPAVFRVNGCCFRKGSVEGPPNYSLHLSPKWLLLHKKVLLLGSKLRGLLTCLNRRNTVRRKRPIMSDSC